MERVIGSQQKGGAGREAARRPVRLLVLAVMLAGCFWMAWNVPYTHDDWDWGLPIGLEWLRTAALNNRYVGSLFVVAMTRSWILKAAVMGGVMFALPLLAAAAADTGHKNWFPLSLLGCGLLMTMPTWAWRQTYGWVSAFSNFVVLGIWMLLLILLARRGIGEAYHGWTVPAALFLLGLTAQLFAENVTVVIAAAAVGLAVWSLAARRGRPAALALLAGALAGLAVMFSNPLYKDLAAEGQALDGLRTLIFSPDDGIAGILTAVVRCYIAKILPCLFENYSSIWAALCAGALYQVKKTGKVPGPALVPAGLFCAAAVVHGVCVSELRRRDFFWTHPSALVRAALPFGVTVLLGLALLLLCRVNWRAWLPRLALLAGALASMAPFALLGEDGPRGAFPSAVLLLVLALSMLADLPWRTAGTAGAGVLMAAALAFHIQAFQVIGNCYSLRLELMREAVEQGESRVILPTEALRYYYTWGHNPQNADRAVSYRAFYGLPEDMELVFLPKGSYDVWPEVTAEMLEEADRF